MVLFFWSHNWYVRVWQSREEACIHQELLYYTYVPWWLQKSTSCEEGINEKQQSSNVCCVLHYKQQANKACFKQTPKQLQITLAFKGHFVLYPESHLYRNAARFDVPFLILKRRNFLFKLFAFRALICLTELCKKQRP